jgi:hypothetical protein
MIELALVQRASRLRFSDEITRVSRLLRRDTIDTVATEQIGSLYKEYLRFINQIHFREVNTQDQGIELYQLIYKTLDIEEHVEDIEKEINELYQYVDLVDDKIRNKNAEILNYIAAGFLPASLFFTLLSINYDNTFRMPFVWTSVAIGVCVSALMLGILYLIKNHKNKSKWKRKV